MSGLIKGIEVHFDDNYLYVKLDDGRIISTPISWYKPLESATLAELKNYHFICMNTGIEWEALDYHLNIENMLLNSEEQVA